MKRLALIAGGIAGLLVVAVVTAGLLVDANSFRPLLEHELTQALAREVKLGDLKLSLLSGSVIAGDLSIADNPAYSREPFVKAKSLAVAVEVWPLIRSKQLRVTGLTIDHPSIALTQSANGEWNFSSLGGNNPAKSKAAEAAPKEALDLSVKLVKIAGGRFSLARGGSRARPLVLEDVDVEIKDFSTAGVFPFSLAAKVAGGGSIKLDGKAGPIDAADTAASPFTVSLNIDQLDLAGSGVTHNAPAIAGLISLAGSGASDGKTVQIKGKLKGEKLKLAKSGTPAKRTVELDFAANHNRRKLSGRLEHGNIRIGSAPASLTGTYAAEGESTALHMTLDGPKMAIAELEGMLPALGVVLPNGSTLQGGTATIKMTMDGVLERLVTTGSVSVDNTKLAGFDMGRKLAFVEALAGIKTGADTEIQTFASGIRMGPDGMTADNIQLIVPSIGTLAGNGSVNPANALDFHMRANVRNVPVPFTVAGTASDPVFRPDVKAAVKEQAGKAVGGLMKSLLGGKN